MPHEDDLKPQVAAMRSDLQSFKDEQAIQNSEMKEQNKATFDAVASGFSDPTAGAAGPAILAILQEMKNAPSILKNLDSAVERARLEAQAVKEGKKVVEKDGKLSLEDRTFFEKVGDYAAPIAMTAAGTLVGIGVYEGVRAGYNWATSDDDPIDI